MSRPPCRGCSAATEYATVTYRNTQQLRALHRTSEVTSFLMTDEGTQGRTFDWFLRTLFYALSTLTSLPLASCPLPHLLSTVCWLILLFPAL